MAKLDEYPGFLTRLVRLLQQHAEPRHRPPARPGQDVRRLRDANPDAAAQRLLPELPLPDQEAGGPVPGDPRDGGLGARSTPRTCRCSTSGPTTGKNLVPLSALVTWKTTLGPQAVNHLNQFTSVTLFFNLKPGVALGDATDYITKTAAEIVPPTLRARVAGRGADVPATRSRDLTILMVLAVFVMYVILAILYESYVHPLTVLSTLPTALVGGLLTLLALRRGGVALRVRRHVHADGHREEERHHDRRLRAPARRGRRDRRAGDPRREHGPLPPDPDDDAGGGHRRACRSRWATAPTARRAGRSAW